MGLFAMKKRRLEVIIDYDAEAKVYYVSNSDVPGLATEAEDLDQLVENCLWMIPELIEANGHNMAREFDIGKTPSFVPHTFHGQAAYA